MRGKEVWQLKSESSREILALRWRLSLNKGVTGIVRAENEVFVN